MAKKTPVGKWKKVEGASQQGLLADVKSFGIKSATKIVWALLLSDEPRAYFLIAETRRKKDPYDAIMLAGSGKHTGKYRVERSPTIAAAKRAGTNIAKHFKDLKKIKRRKNVGMDDSAYEEGNHVSMLVVGGFVLGMFLLMKQSSDPKRQQNRNQQANQNYLYHQHSYRWFGEQY